MIAFHIQIPSEFSPDPKDPYRNQQNVDPHRQYPLSIEPRLPLRC